MTKKEKKALYDKEYRKANSEKIKFNKKLHYIKNAEKIRAKVKKWRLENAEKAKKTGQIYYKKNKEAIDRKNKLYIQEHPETAKKSIRIFRKRHPEKAKEDKRKRRNRELNAEGFHTNEQWENLKKRYKYTCLCCKKQEPEIKLTEDHIIPLSRGGSDYIKNIQPLCQSCNSRKHTKTIKY